MKAILYAILVIELLTQKAQAGYYFQAQRAVQDAGKPYEATGTCLEHPKSFEIASQIFKRDGESGSSIKEKNNCKVLSKEHRVVCQVIFNGALFSTNTTYWFNSKDVCEKNREHLLKSANAHNLKMKSYSMLYKDYKYNEAGNGRLIGASKNCWGIKANTETIKDEIEKIAKKDGFLEADGSCKDGAFQREFSCQKNEALGRSYQYFESTSDCKYQLSEMRKNYNLN